MKKIVPLSLALSALALASACGSNSAAGGSGDLEGLTGTIGSKDFSEQYILAYITGELLNANGADVDVNTQLVGSANVRQALENGDFIGYWEYTGTSWITYNGETTPITDPQEQFEAVKEADAAHGIAWLDPAPMNNTYAFAIREAEAERLGVTKLSDLARLDRSDLTFCVESEFASRNDGFVPMLQAYGLTRDALGRITHLDTGVIYTATANGDCNFGEVFTTDGRIPALNLRVLEDDKQFFPLYNLTEVIETDLLTAHPELAEIFAQLNPKLTNETMMTLNAKVDSEGDDPALVARDWLIQQGLLT
jgi:osmoprotectant transport system substrate-binding protein